MAYNFVSSNLTSRFPNHTTYLTPTTQPTLPQTLTQRILTFPPFLAQICRKPTRANEHQLHYFASKDMGVSHTLFRRFFWSENILWKEDIGHRRVTVVLGGKDLIVDTQTVRRYLMGGYGRTKGGLDADDRKKACLNADDMSGKEGGKDEGLWKGNSNNLDVLWYPQLDHAQVFDKKRTRKQLVDVTRRYCQK